ncbi:SDR family oxidoreductase [Levilactobacillus senmaizukei]|nr:SDR family oxidoreductase [Levilactobacillus senmaizukei]
MTTLVIGAHGRVGQFIVKDLAATGETVYGSVRNDAQVTTMKTLGGQARPVDLMGSVDDLAAAMAGIDRIIFTAGSGGNTGDDMTLNIDLDGAIKTMMAAEKVGIKRFVLVSAIGTDDRAFWNKSGIRPYYVAKYYADQWLQHRTNLDYTIVRPGILTDAAATGKITLDPSASASKEITRADVAATVVAVLAPAPKLPKIISIVNDATPIKTAVDLN